MSDADLPSQDFHTGSPRQVRDRSTFPFFDLGWKFQFKHVKIRRLLKSNPLCTLTLNFHIDVKSILYALRSIDDVLQSVALCFSSIELVAASLLTGHNASILAT